MAKQPSEPRVSVRQRVDVSISKEEVEHALRCWLAHQLAPSMAPEPDNFSSIIVSVNADDGGLYGASFTYEPRLQAKGGTSS
ncbi:MAG: hypothetical protein DI537_20430 [Stutzerimonas stutzeri]|nr:MAG: hypothetical protein DI537_20430 [Stutzerimonas stutzeri]